MMRLAVQRSASRRDGAVRGVLRRRPAAARPLALPPAHVLPLPRSRWSSAAGLAPPPDDKERQGSGSRSRIPPVVGPIRAREVHTLALRHPHEPSGSFDAVASRHLLAYGSGLSSTQSCGSPYGAHFRYRRPHPLACQSVAFFTDDPRQQGARPLRSLGTTRVPTPPSAPPEAESALESLRKTTPTSLLRKGADLAASAARFVVGLLARLPGGLWFYLWHPDELRQRLAELKKTVQDEIHHYWVGFKLFWAELQTAKGLVMRTLSGSSLTRRERKQLLRTVTDLFRLVPFSMFIIIPFMEFALPLALRIFPNMLPSTFQDSLKAEEQMKRELQSRISMTRFFQETLEELAKEQKRKAAKKKKELIEAGEDDTTIHQHEDSAASMLEFLEKARRGETIPPDVIIRYANYFHDDLTLDNMPRMQLINMCKYMGIPHYGSDALLQFQLRYKIRSLREDDQRILWEGIDSLTKSELREACRERGMRSTGLSKDAYKWSLQQWLDLSVNKNVPISLLIMSRTFFLRDELAEPSRAVDESASLAAVVDTISGLDKEVLNEVILGVATADEKKADPNIRKIKLEVLSAQNQLIRQEQEARDAAAKKKESSEKTDEKIESVDGADKVAAGTETKEAAIDSAPSKQLATDETIAAIKEVVDEEKELSADEMEAISQLISDDPVSKERAELERIKAAMNKKETVKEDEAKSLDMTSPPSSLPETADAYISTEPMTSAEVDRIATTIVEQLKDEAKKEADASTSISMDGSIPLPSAVEEHHEPSVVSPAQPDAEEEEDPVVRRLKKRLESMVDKIEVQLSEVQVRIGDKLHFLDKDRDEIITREEMAEVLQQVLKRKISMEEAMEIASAMDENKDGVFTVDELIRWIEENKLVKFVEEGRDVDIDRVMESQSDIINKDDTEAKLVDKSATTSNEVKV